MKPPFKIALAGLGTVGAGTLNLLQRNADVIAARAGRPLVVTAVSARDKGKERGCTLTSPRWVDDPLQLPGLGDVDVVVELIGGADGVAQQLCEATLGQGKPVVTANKALLAKHGVALARLAETHHVPLMFEAAVAGGVPVIKTLREAFAGNRIQAIQGILNGTCNYILTRMGVAGLTFADALQEAQAQGFAEANPSMDVDGHDTAHKLAILAALAFGFKPKVATITLEGIRRVSPLDLTFASELGYRIKLLGAARLTQQGLEQWVGPCLVPLASPLAHINEALNAVRLKGDAVGTVALSGPGAGADPTASAVVGDLIDIARGTTTLPFTIPAAALTEAVVTPMDQRVTSWYMRLQVKDQPGVVADVASLLRDEVISIESLLQHGRSATDSVPVVITTHAIHEAAMRRAMGRIAALKSVQEEPCLLRIEDEQA